MVHIWPDLTQTINLRINGIDTPEKRKSAYSNPGECEKALGKQATEFTRAFIGEAATVTVSDVFLGKYAKRAIGSLSVNGQELSKALIAAGLAKPYEGGKKLAWCQSPVDE